MSKILSIQVGKPREMGTPGAADPMDQPWVSGFFKWPVDGAVWAGQTGIVGDGQADLKNHGGPEKAILAYAGRHYADWKAELGLEEMPPGGFGENLTLDGWDESNVCIGDTFMIGDVSLQVSQPRQPCWKINRRWRIADLAQRIQINGRTGWYFRVLKEGWLTPGAEIALVQRPLPEWPVAAVSRLLYERTPNRENAAVLAACPLLAMSWRKWFRRSADAE